jgi:hypothetical protein
MQVIDSSDWELLEKLGRNITLHRNAASRFVASWSILDDLQNVGCIGLQNFL